MNTSEKPDSADNNPRVWAEKEAANDLKKTPQQLLCDTIEETLIGQYKQTDQPESEEARLLRCLLGATRRLTSLQTVNALSSSKTNDWMKRLTVGLFALTVVLVIQTSVLMWMTGKMMPSASLPEQHPPEQEQAAQTQKADKA